MNIEQLYTPIDDARAEVRRRWNDERLRRQVETLLDGPPSGCVTEPRACLCRAVHTPNREFSQFAEQAKAVGCRPAALEYHRDRYYGVNPDKRALLRLTFVTGTNILGKPIFRRIMLADATHSEGTTFGTIITQTGASLICFHSRLLQACFPEIVPTDESSWLHARGATPGEFYHAVFTRFICHGILFEDYLDKSPETHFLRDVIMPAFNSVCDTFGMKPLIVPLTTDNTAGHPSWMWYDGHAADLLTMTLPANGVSGLS